MKRIFVILLTFVLLLGICPMSALAETGGSGNVDGGGGDMGQGTSQNSWNPGRVSDGVERDLLQKLKLLGGYFSDSGIQTEILEQQHIVRLCNLVNNPAYVHLEDSGINAAIPILESVGVA